MEIKLEDLFIKCGRCNGTGSYEEVNENLTTIGMCPDCNGTGGHLTESGRALHEFMLIMNRGRASKPPEA